MHGFTSGNLQDLRGEPNGSLDAKILILRPVDEINRDYRAGEHGCFSKRIMENRHFSRFLTFPEVRVILILWILAGGRGAPVASYSLSPLAT